MNNSKCAMILWILFVANVRSQFYLARVIQGSPTTIDRYPIVAQLLLDAWDTQQFTQQCAGVILTARHVISTAHCFQYNRNTGRDGIDALNEKYENICKVKIAGRVRERMRERLVRCEMSNDIKEADGTCGDNIFIGGLQRMGSHYEFIEISAHAYSQPQYWKIRVGSTYRSYGGSVYNVKTIIHHPDFDRSYYNNDIAVLVIEKRIVFNSEVRQGTLIKQGVEIKPNSVAMLVGWGVTEMNGPQPEQLQQTTMFTIDQNVCKQRYSTIQAIVSNSMMCAGKLDASGPDGCFGDSGGPLIYKGLVAGLVSFGYSCGHPFYPGVYTKISHFTDWIVKTIFSNK